MIASIWQGTDLPLSSVRVETVFTFHCVALINGVQCLSCKPDRWLTHRKATFKLHLGKLTVALHLWNSLSCWQPEKTIKQRFPTFFDAFPPLLILELFIPPLWHKTLFIPPLPHESAGTFDLPTYSFSPAFCLSRRSLLFEFVG